MDVKDVLGGGSVSWEFGLPTSIEAPSYFSEATDAYKVAKNGEIIDVNNPFWNQTIVGEDATKIMYQSSSILHSFKDIIVPQSFCGIVAKEIDFHGKTLEVTATGVNFSGNVSTNNSQTMLTSFKKQLRGGDGYAPNNYVATLGENWLSGASFNETYSIIHNGGGAIIIVSDNIVNTTLNANGVGYAGGGMILIYVKEWNGSVGINVSGHQAGSYAIYKRNTDGTETLMVHSKNGVSADLDGETPVYGADASITW